MSSKDLPNTPIKAKTAIMLFFALKTVQLYDHTQKIHIFHSTDTQVTYKYQRMLNIKAPQTNVYRFILTCTYEG